VSSELKDYYSILGISRSASEEEIREAYRRLAKRWHPDANLMNENSSRMMQDLNRAKEVLFEEDTREEYLRLLNLQDSLSSDNIERLRKKWGDTGFAVEHTEEERKDSPKFPRRKFYFVIVLLVVGLSVAFISAMQRSKAPSRIDPVQEIIERNRSSFGTTINDPRADTTNVPDSPPDRLAQQAALLSMMQEYHAAAKYWEKALTLDPHNPEIITNLIFHYLKQKNYERAFAIIETNVDNESNKIIIYDRIGEFFLLEGKRMDAMSAFEKAVLLGSRASDRNEKALESLRNAQMHIDRGQ
jgi:tetratricopeptide (TPR) repeat protein